MKKSLLNIASAAALAAGMVFAQSTPPAPPAGTPGQGQAARGHMRHNFMQRMAQQLNLTDAQKEQGKAIFSQAKQTAEPIVQQLKQNREAMAAAVKANNQNQIQQLAATQGSLLGQLTAIRTEAMAKFYAGLTPDQRAKADQMHQQMKQRFEQHFRGRSNG